ncbi:MAG: phytanoyl-CoA dioxygenase family protein [Acidobacteriota bacterium]|nr:phytanoyl-CoA dioxygenase family protein [Acidobacteriota bacterium]
MESETADSGPTRAQHAAGLDAYRLEGERLAAEIGNRGPLVVGADGKLRSDILEAYWEHGYYIFEGVVDKAEVEELRAGVAEMIERAPVDRDSTVDAKGRAALGQSYARSPYLFARPLADPWGGTQLLGGRHPAQMTQPRPDASAPRDVVFLISSMCQAMPAALRLYGHPRILAVAASLNGDDFVPFNDAIFVKQPGLGGSVAWHQDGVTHWDSPEWDEGIHGFNFQVQLYPTSAGSCLWVVPGTHKLGKIDIKARIAQNGGSEQLSGALPLCCDAGDVTIVNRQLLHASFANSSPDLRVSVTFGFHRRSSVEGQSGALGVEADGVVYDAQRIFDRSAVVAVAIDARHQEYPDEVPFVYQPFVGLEDEFRLTDAVFERVIRDYNTRDLAI